jgi:hypothetical protein
MYTVLEDKEQIPVRVLQNLSEESRGVRIGAEKFQPSDVCLACE